MTNYTSASLTLLSSRPRRGFSSGSKATIIDKAISSILTISRQNKHQSLPNYVIKTVTLADKIFLTSALFKADKPHNACKYRQGS
jgi:hypothetical protein